MLSERQTALLAQPHTAVIGVNRAKGGPQLTVVWFAYDGKDFYFSTTKDRAKYRNINRDPAISLLVEGDMFTTVVVYGQAEIIEHDFERLARLIIERYVPIDQREQMIQNTVNDPDRVIVVLHPEKIV
jgi:PPOX class probable F420-dependent enzyme